MQSGLFMKTYQYSTATKSESPKMFPRVTGIKLVMKKLYHSDLPPVILYEPYRYGSLVAGCHIDYEGGKTVPVFVN